MLNLFKKAEDNVQKTWTIVLLKTSEDWYVNYIHNKLTYQIEKNELNDYIKVTILNNILEIEDQIKDYGDYVNVIEDGEISDEYITTIYKAIKKCKKDCIIFSGVFIKDGDEYIFNQVEENNEEIFIPISQMNPIKREIIYNDINNYINDEIKLNNFFLLKDILVYIHNQILVNENTQPLSELYSIVIPTMWVSDKIHDMLLIYEKSYHVKEVILIDNNPLKKPDLSKYTKIKYYTKGHNIYVNPSWNWGASLANEKLIIANDDIFINNLDEVLKEISNSDYDIIGVNLIRDGESVKIETIDHFPAQSYGCFMFVKKYFYIPEQLKIWYGDNILFNNNPKKGILKNAKISANKSETINSNMALFRDKLGQDDIVLYNSLTSNLYSKINIIIRTSNRPIYFNKCISSIRKNCPDAKLHIIVDNEGDLEYVKLSCFDFNYSYYLVNKESVENICRKIKIERNIFIYNYYFNIIKPFLNGWCIFLDDDDELLINPPIPESLEDINLFKVDIEIKVVPCQKNFGQKPVLNDISGLGILFHSSKMEDWKPQRGGDFEFIEKMYNKCNPIWIDRVISKTQTGGNFGKRNDTKFSKLVSANIATYPPRKETLIKCIHNLLSFDFLDIIRVYLNEYTFLPENFPKNDKIIYYLGGIDLKDSGKYYWANEYKNEYYFTLDDDLIYPKSFFINHILLLLKYDEEVFVTSHGKEMNTLPSSFNDNIKNFHCLRNVEEDEWVNNGGTGVMVFDNSKYRIDINMFEYHGMADLWIAYYCQKKQIPIICRKHKEDELTYMENANTLFDRRDELKEMHHKVLDKIGEWFLYKKKIKKYEF